GSIVRVTRGVRHQVVETDILRSGEMRVIFRDLVVDGQLAVLGEQQDAGGDELLGDGANGEARLRSDGAAALEGSLAVALDEDGLAVAQNDEREADESLLLDLGGDVGVDGLEIEGLRWFGDRRRRRGRR